MKINKIDLFSGILVIVSIFIANNMLFAQAGGSSVPFLRIAPDARSSGMGETGVAIADDANSVYWNPGGLGFLDYFNEGDDYTDPELYRQVTLSFSPRITIFISLSSFAKKLLLFHQIFFSLISSTSFSQPYRTIPYLKQMDC